MSFAGNDNYRPGLNMPDPIKPGSGWLSGNLAQLMVFLNGLILTITAFGILSVFIDEVVREGLLKSTQETQQYIQSHVEEAQQSLYALSSVIDMSDKISANDFVNYAQDENMGIQYYDQILWIKPNVQSEGESWTITSLLTSAPYDGTLGTQETLVNFIKERLKAKEKIAFVSNLPNNNKVLQTRSQAEDVNPFGFIIKQATSKGYLFGVGEFSNLIDTAEVLEKTSVVDLQILNVTEDRNVFTFFNGEQSAGSRQFLNVISSSFADKEINTRIKLKISARESFLQKIPLLMLLFGVTLTLIGTLYVRNNQNQSRKLSEMNKELAHKNFEMSQEVSERERLNKIIQKSAREHRAIINAVTDIIFEMDDKGKIIFLNEAWHSVTGFDVERSMGQELNGLLHIQDQAEQKENFNQLISGKKQSYRTFTRIRSENGTYRAVELAMSMLVMDDDKELRVVGTITDIEERRRVEQALFEAEKKYRRIVENAAGGIYQMSEEGKIISANPAYAKIIGYDNPEDVLENVQDANILLYKDSVAREKCLHHVLMSKKSTHFEAQVQTKDGDVIWVRENVRAVMDDEGEFLFFEGSIEDIDKRKKAEIALQDAKVESDLANRAKSEFLTNMSHELRTPLNAIIGFSEIIRNEVYGKLPSTEYKDHASNIYESGHGLLKVINEILDVSRIEVGERTLQEGVVNIKDIFADCLQLMQGKIKEANFRIENKKIDAGLSVIGEKQAIKQMLLNLMANAIKFSPENSLMMLDAEIDSKQRLRVSVTDTGVGLTEEEIEKALSPFGQIETEHSRTKSGTGLGLTLVKSLIELHGGKLEIVSQKGIGTTVTLIFPEKRVAKTKEGQNIVDISSHSS